MSSPLTSAPPQPAWPYSWPEIFRMSYRELVDAMLDAAPPQDLPLLAKDRLEAFATEATGSYDDGYPSCRMDARLTHVFEELPEPSGYQLRITSLNGWDVSWGGLRLDRAGQQELAGLLDIEGVAALLPDRLEVYRYCPTLRQTIPAGSNSGVDWPMPQHTTCWGYEDAARLLAEAEQRWTGQPDPRFGAWIDAMTEVVENALGVQPDPPRFAEWPSLTARLEALKKQPLGMSWHTDVNKLCVRDMGMTNPGSVRPKGEGPEQGADAPSRDATPSDPQRKPADPPNES